MSVQGVVTSQVVLGAGGGEGWGYIFAMRRVHLGGILAPGSVVYEGVRCIEPSSTVVCMVSQTVVCVRSPKAKK